MDEFKSKYVEINALKEEGILTVKFIGFIPLEEFKKVLQVEYELIEKHQLTKVLIDIRELSTYASGAPELIKEEWFPKVKSLGMKFIAFVQPQAALAKMGMKKAHNVSPDTQINMQHFGSMEEAKNWLNSN
jgi:hypothetical protein